MNCVELKKDPLRIINKKITEVNKGGLPVYRKMSVRNNELAYVFHALWVDLMITKKVKKFDQQQ